LGFRPDRKRFPRFVRLLNRVAEDALAVGGEAKKRYPRPRPFQRFALTRVCGQAKVPKPDASPSGGTSYPSGHAVVSWAVALVMMEASPQGAQAIVLRAVDFGESRVVCGLHFPSDIDAGHLVATAVIDKLFALPEFRRDFQCAKTELQSVRAGMRAEDLPACQ
jgi:acid phosphatase (class A)